MKSHRLNVGRGLTRAVRKERANQRQEERSNRSQQEQVDKLDFNLGKNQGAKKERQRLSK